MRHVRGRVRNTSDNVQYVGCYAYYWPGVAPSLWCFAQPVSGSAASCSTSDPNMLAMYAAMWSEHCSYKSSKIHLRTLPTEGDAVLVGPGQDAGAVDLGDGMAAVFKMESHSHPSAIEPYQGAATGVGGIVRDIVSMGARPIALLDPLMFGPLTDPRNRWLLEGVVAGIGGYGNCIGVPTVGGEIRFAEPHSANPTVDVMCVGIA